ncbi:hypothetical protein [Tabrizicola sp. YIM 78059]|nr:hypothetical protein [Tabrizicola sp. YIM 78059]
MASLSNSHAQVEIDGAVLMLADNDMMAPAPHGTGSVLRGHL